MLSQLEPLLLLATGFALVAGGRVYVRHLLKDSTPGPRELRRLKSRVRLMILAVSLLLAASYIGLRGVLDGFLSLVEEPYELWAFFLTVAPIVDYFRV